MALSSMQVFQEEVQSSMTEVLADKTNLFNAASNGALILESDSFAGDYSKEAFYKKISGLVRRRNAYGSGAVTAKSLTQDLTVSVKVAAGTPPVTFNLEDFNWINKDPVEAGVVIGEQMAGDMLSDMLNTAVSALVAAMTNVGATVVHDGTAGTATLNALNSGAALFGDRSGSIAAWLLHSKVAHNIYDVALTNANRLFEFGTVQVIQDGFGRPLIVFDSSSSITAGTPDTYHTLGLVQGAVNIRQQGFTDNFETSNGDENIIRTYQAEWAYGLGLKGYAWDTTNGGKSPNDAALATGTNWDKVATSIKDTAGILVNTQ